MGALGEDLGGPRRVIEVPAEGLGAILEGSSGSWGTQNTHICEEFWRFPVCLEQVYFFMFFVAPLPSEYFWKHFKSLFGPKACLGMVRGGLWRKDCASKSFQWPVRDRKLSILNVLFPFTVIN